ncbi:flagellar M-ring protein FliF [Halobacillus litoralis]|uniref:flagellar basal-body MS-ring/collar protein FliF n=1 Tax=Halobacillus litoralis TaxID=45668 RepID=UPI001CD65D13|nr:flagellar basal-body MS-ring/collar protein FliF [Halobacillus litoralis]MCA0969144.1 flagellar M-ring protein FliF [Halobacillus litoralis]
MKEKLSLYQERIKTFWTNRSKIQKGLMIGSGIAVILALVMVSIFASSSKMVPLYNGLTLQEVGQVKAELDTRGVPYELTEGGTTIMVPEPRAEALLVDMAASGLPSSGSIDYSFFSANTSWGMTDNEFGMIRLDAMQSELANLMMGITGIQDAQVMINLPEETVFLDPDSQQAASASIVLGVQPGYQLENQQIEALYNLASKSVPNLSKDNIVIMDQNFQYYDTENSNSPGSGDLYTYQQQVKQDIERDIKQRVQRMLGQMIGQQKVIATVTADIDFTQENRVEELVEPVDPETMSGLPVSVERIEETYEGGVPEDGGVPGAGDEDIANYPAGVTGANGDYEMTRETINNEFNRIRRNIEEAPYKVRDLGIQVAIDNTRTDENGETITLTAQEQQTVQDGVQSILDSMITTSINGSYGEVNPDEKVSIVFQEFNGQTVPQQPGFSIPVWAYAVGAVLAAIIGVLVWMLVRRRNEEEEEEYEEVFERVPEEIPDIEEKFDESTQRRKQLEKMARDKPEEFAKLLRSWIAED